MSGLENMPSDNDTVMSPMAVEEVLKNKPQNFEMARKAKRGKHQCYYYCGKFFNTKEEAENHQPCAMRAIDEERWNKLKAEHDEEWSTPSTTGSMTLGSDSSDDSIQKEKSRLGTRYAKDFKEGSQEDDGVPGSFSKAVDDCNKSVEQDMLSLKSYLLRVKALIELGKPNDAINDLTKAINLLNDLNRRTEPVCAGPKEGYGPNPIFPGIQTLFNSRDSRFSVNNEDDYEDDQVKEPDTEVYPKNDPQKKDAKDKQNKSTNSGGDNRQLKEERKRVSSTDYSSWEKFDVENACDDVDAGKEMKKEKSEEQKIKRRAITLRLQAIAAEKKQQGNQYLQEKNYAKAIECYTEGIRCDKENALLYSNRAQAYIFDKQFSKAVEDCNKSIEQDSTYVKSYFRRAKALIELGKLNDAKKDLTKTLNLDPKNSAARNLLNDLNRRTEPVRAGPKEGYRANPIFPGIQTLFNSRGSRFSVNNEDDYEDDLVKKPDTEVYPKKITPIVKPENRRSKRPLLTLHVKITGGGYEEKRKKLVTSSKSFDSSQQQQSGENSSCFSSFDGETGISSSFVSSPTSEDYSNAPTPPSTALLSNSTSLPSLFSRLEMVAAVPPPPKPKTAAQFIQTWKQIKSKPDVSAQYLNQLDAKDYLIFQDSMEYSILSDILDLLVWEFLPRKWDILRHLVGLTKIRRFSTLLMFTTEKDRANVRKLLTECPEELQADLKRKYEF